MTDTWILIFLIFISSPIWVIPAIFCFTFLFIFITYIISVPLTLIKIFLEWIWNGCK